MGPPARTIVLPRRLRPHEVGLLVISVITGLGIFIAPAPEITAVFPGWNTWVWAATVLVSGVVGLVGCLWRGRVSTSLITEGAGLLLSVAAVIWYMAGAYIVRTDHLLSTELTVATWGVINLWRVAQIHLDLRELS